MRKRVRKQMGWRNGILIFVLLCTCCEDPLDNKNTHPQKNIGFTICTGEYNTAIAPRVFPLKSDPGTDPPLYLHAVVTDGIEGGAGMKGEKKSSTRAAPVTTATLYSSLGVLAYVFPGSSSWSETLAPNYMYNVEVQGSTNWTTSYYWPGPGKKIRFFAYAPFNCAGLTLPERTVGGTPVISYTTPSAVSDQKDLLVASTAELPGNTNATVPLELKHCLTAVRFVVGDDMLPGTVTQISLKGVYGQGNYQIGDTAWSDFGSVKDFVQTLSVATNGTPDSAITTPEATFMMVPQALPSGAGVEIVFTDSLTAMQRILTASVAGSAWPVGKTVMYRISTSSISVTPALAVTAPDHYTYAGGSKSYTVASYLEVSRSGDPTTTIPVAWSTEFSEDGVNWSTTKPDWLTGFTASGAGGATDSTYTATVAAQTLTMENAHNDALRSATPVSNYDLSTNGGAAAMSTANCYLVNAPGTYRLPLVYGNAIKNGAANSSAYTSTKSGSNILTNFVNHLDVAITDPYIYNNANCTPASCTLIWQDEPDLVTDVALSPDGHFLTFTVNQGTIRQGNAIVAVRDASDNIMWSWHIWITDYVLGTDLKTITNYQNHQYTILPVNIGWCDGTTNTYPERSVQVRFTQQAVTGQAPAAPQTITIQQDAYSSGTTSFGNNPYYQWGRKDPMLPGMSGNTDKSCYTTDPSYAFDKNGTGKVSIGTAIKNPYKFYKGGENDDWCSVSYKNLWSADNEVFTANDNPVVKTVYDPSPAGYCLPPGNAFTGFSTTGNNTSIASEFNVSGSWDKGWNFYCGLNKTGATTFFPATGYRHWSGGLTVYSTNGPHYLAMPSSLGKFRIFVFTATQIFVLYTRYGNVIGNPIRPVQEF